MRNDEVSRLLDRIADLLELQGESRFRVNAYHEAARSVANLETDVEELWREGRLEEIPGVGESISARIDEFLKTGRCRRLDELEASVPRGAAELSRVPGLGPRRARMIADRLKIRSVTELIHAAETHQIRDLPGMGARSEENLLLEARRLGERTRRIPLFVAWPLADAIAQRLRQHPAVLLAEPAGSIRRRKETIGDVDLLVASNRAGAVFDHLVGLSEVAEVLLRGPTKISVLTREGLQVDVRVVEPDTWGAALQYFTGSKAHNIHLRQLAIARGYKISEYGLFRSSTGQRLAGRTEAEIYETLGMEWIPPELREDTGEIEAAAAAELPELLELADVKGDCHVHTTYSDGRDSLEAMARQAISLGYHWLLVTDHSYGLTIAQGLDEVKALEQRKEIGRLNRELAPFRLLQGLELEIRPDGSLDFPDAVLKGFDAVGASLHVATRRGAASNTQRLVGALRDAEVDGLNHPTGRILGVRGPYDVDLAAILRVARRQGKVLEINGSERLDLSDEAARLACQAGLDFTLSTDAHAASQLSRMRYAVAIARRAWIPKSRILNVLEAPDLLARLGRRPPSSQAGSIMEA